MKSFSTHKPSGYSPEIAAWSAFYFCCFWKLLCPSRARAETTVSWLVTLVFITSCSRDGASAHVPQPESQFLPPAASGRCASQVHFLPPEVNP